MARLAPPLRCIYEIERWIQAGKPIQATHYDVRRKRFNRPIEIAIERDLYDVALLLLCNGYRLELDTSPFGSAPDHALNDRAWGFVDLLLEWGADPKAVDPDSVFSTYRQDLFDRFWEAGLDFSDRHALAWQVCQAVFAPQFEQKRAPAGSV